MRRVSRRWVTPLAVLAVVAVLALMAVWEGDLPENLGDLTGVVRVHLPALGPVAAIGLLYLEESGLPLPVPGDAIMLYVGRAAGSWAAWIASWLAIVLVVVAGASNLYLIARRWGSRLLGHRLSSAFHLNPHRVARARSWFDRWGPLAVIFGRHLPGFRIPLTVVAGIFEMPYPHFVASVTISAAPWAAFWLWLGARYGRPAQAYLGQHRWLYWIGSAAVGVVLAYFVVRVVRALQRPDPAASSGADGAARPAAAGGPPTPTLPAGRPGSRR